MKLGGKIGNGSRRDVYHHPDDPGLVVKVCKFEGKYNEWEKKVWDYTKKQGFEHLLAPVISVSDDYKYLVMLKGVPVVKDEDVISQNDLPWFLRKDTLLPKNFVKISGVVKICDYDDCYQLIFLDEK